VWAQQGKTEPYTAQHSTAKQNKTKKCIEEKHALNKKPKLSTHCSFKPKIFSVSMIAMPNAGLQESARQSGNFFFLFLLTEFVS